jgi:hypothetical protein
MSKFALKEERKTPLKKYDYREFNMFHVTNVTRQMKKTINQDRRQKGISESALIKSIIDQHYQLNPLRINPAFLEED